VDAQSMLQETVQSRISLSNEWTIKVIEALEKASGNGWPTTHVPELIKQPVEVQERVMGYFRDKGFRAEYGTYGGWGLDTIWFSSEPPKAKEPGLVSKVVHRLFGGSFE